MADPISLAASVIALLNAVHVGGQGLARLKASYNAPPEIARLKAEVESLEQLLKSVQEFVHRFPKLAASHSADLLCLPVKSATAHVDSLTKTISSPAFGLSRLNDANRARATILRYKKRLSTIEREIKQSIQDISVRLVLITAVTTGEIHEDIVTSRSSHESHLQGMTLPLDGKGITNPEHSESPASTLNDSTNQFEFGRRRRSDGSSVSLPPYPQEEGPRPVVPTLSRQHRLKKRYDCHPGCTCQCHLKGELHSPWLVQSVFGQLDIYWRSQRQGLQCDCSGHRGIAITYRFPSYILQRYVNFVLQTTHLDPPELLLRVPRVLPWTHVLWKYSVNGDLMAIRKLYAERKVSQHDVDPSGRNALLYASKQESAELAEFLLVQGVDSNQPDRRGIPPSELLLKRSFGGMYGEYGPSIMRHVLRDDDSYDEFGFTTLHKIVLGLIIKDLYMVLEATTDTVNTVDSIGRTALFWAVICDNIEKVELLLAYGASVNARDSRGFMPIDFVRGPAVCKALLDAGASNNINSLHYNSSIHEQVIENGSVEVMALFADAGWDIDIRDRDNETPLLNSIYAGHTAVAKLLIERGADVNAANLSSKDSALHFAAKFDRPEIFKMLLDADADYTVLDSDGRNFAHCAARTASTEFIKIMTNARLSRLDLTKKDFEGKTANDYMEERIVLSDSDIGVHEAWEDFGSGPPAMNTTTDPSLQYMVGKAQTGVYFSLEHPETVMHVGVMEELKMPGAFPTVQIQEIEAQ